MAISNHERVGKAMELLKEGLGPFIEREFKNAFQKAAKKEAENFMKDDRMLSGKQIHEWDVSALLILMWESWNAVFKNVLGFAERSLVSELRDARNKWAHQETFSSDDTDLVSGLGQRCFGGGEGLGPSRRLQTAIDAHIRLVETLTCQTVPDETGFVGQPLFVDVFIDLRKDAHHAIALSRRRAGRFPGGSADRSVGAVAIAEAQASAGG